MDVRTICGVDLLDSHDILGLERSLALPAPSPDTAGLFRQGASDAGGWSDPLTSPAPVPR